MELERQAAGVQDGVNETGSKPVFAFSFINSFD